MRQLSTSGREVCIRHNTRVKTYPSGAVEVLTASARVFREAGWEQPDDWNGRSMDAAPDLGDDVAYDLAERAAIMDEDGAAAAAAAAASLARAQRRARTQVRDLAMSNDFRYFVTLTLDGSKVDRYDIRAVTRRLNQWLSNAVRRYGLKYVLVPELHKDGAIHFHGFVNDALRVVDSGTVIPPQGGKPRRPRGEKMRQAWIENGGHVVFNLPQWSLGFSTAIELYGEYSAAVGYVCKYINKEQTKVGGRWFYHGGDLRMPDVTLEDRNVEDVAALGAATFTSPTLAGVTFAVLRVKEGGEMDVRDEQGHAPARGAADQLAEGEDAVENGGLRLRRDGVVRERGLGEPQRDRPREALHARAGQDVGRA